MITIYEPARAVAKLTKSARFKPDTAYVMSPQVVQQHINEGVLLYHTLICALLLLDKKEAEKLAELPGKAPEELKDLVALRFLVPENSDEMTYCDQLKRILKMMDRKDDGITSYTIFTTTDCNARCFYCFELGRSRIPMSEETANATADYILSHCKGKPVKFCWFGGEPLFNTIPIDTITKRMNAEGIPYTSTMISNGYLFDEEFVRRAKDEWNLKRIQITLDGTEEIYNRRKAYIYRNGSAYRRVMKNIGLLIDADIRVNIRLNLDENNYDDLHALVDELAERFPCRKNLNVYNRIIYEKPGESRSLEQRHALYQASDALTDHIYLLGLGNQGGVSRKLKLNHCMADSDTSITVTPEGRLGKCEHYSEKEEMFGDVLSEEIDGAVIESWKEKHSAFPECRDCFYYPKCFQLKKCSEKKPYCDPEYREQRKKVLMRQMMNSYEKWKAKTQTEEQDNIDC